MAFPTAFRVATVSGPTNNYVSTVICHKRRSMKKTDGEPLEIPIRYSQFLRGK
jgi:hypothetical protein